MRLLALLLTALAGPGEQPVDAHTALLWTGFEHRWQRRVIGMWAVPHRVSEFDSRVVDERHWHDGEALTSEFTVRMAQSTGVDGDWMRPTAWFTRVYSPDLQVHRGSLRFETVDHLVDLPAPRAFSRLHRFVSLDAPLREDQVAVALVAGVTFRSRCADRRDACNSDGIWPYRFLVALAPCHARADGLVCPAMVEVGRAWTPNRGGLPGFGVKPLNQRMVLDTELHYVVLIGPRETLGWRTAVFESTLPSTRRIVQQEQVVTGQVPGLSAFRVAAVGLSSFGFQFFPTGKRTKLQHRGRYLQGWGMRVRALGLDPTTETVSVGHEGGIRLPRTVRQSGVGFELGITTVLLGHPEARAELMPVAEGTLCADSEGAPFFSTWRRCGRLMDDRRERSEALVTLRTD